MKNIKIAITSDHAGYERKLALLNKMQVLNLDITDLGAFSAESTDYPHWGHSIAKKIEDGEFDIGITLCGTGNGINMAANKFQGIRSALCWNEEIAELAKKHNDANIIALPARFISDDEAFEIVKAFLNAEFEGGRHQRRIEQLPLKD